MFKKLEDRVEKWILYDSMMNITSDFFIFLMILEIWAIWSNNRIVNYFNKKKKSGQVSLII